MQAGLSGVKKPSNGYQLIDQSALANDPSCAHQTFQRSSSNYRRKSNNHIRKRSKSREKTIPNTSSMTHSDARMGQKKPRTLSFNTNQKDTRSQYAQTCLDRLLGTNTIDVSVEALKNPNSNDLFDDDNYKDERIWSSTTGLLNVNSPANDQINLYQAKCIRSIADMLLCPQTILPIIIGLFNRSGSTARDVYFERLSTELKALNAINTVKVVTNTQTKFKLTPLILCGPMTLITIVGYVLGVIFDWKFGLAVGLTASTFYILLILFLMIGTSGRNWRRAMGLSETLKRYSLTWKLLLNVLFCKVPEAPRDAKPVKLLPITLNLSMCNSAWEGMLVLSDKLTSASEVRYNKLVYRLQWASEDAYSEKKRKYRFACCLPIWTWVIINLITFLFLLYEWISTIKYPNPDKLSFNQLLPPIFSNTSDLGVNKLALRKTYLATVIISSICFCLSGLIILLVIMIPLKNLIYGRRKLNSLKNMHYTDEHPEKSLFMDESPSIVRSCNPSTTVNHVSETLQWPNGGGARVIHGTSSCIKAKNSNSYLDENSQKDLQSAATLAAAAAAAAVTATKSRYRHGSTYNIHNHDEDDSLSSETSQELRQQLTRKTKKKVKRKRKSSVKGEPDRPRKEVGKKSRKKSRSYEKDSHEKKKRSSNKSITGDNFDSEPFEDSLLDSDFEMDRNRKKPSHLTPEETSLRYYLMRTCGVLHKLDARLGDRQTRVIICIDGTTAPNTNTSVSQKKLANFVRLLDRLLMSTTPYSSSGEVSVLLNTSFSPGSKLFTTSWTPSVVVLLMGTETTPWTKPTDENNSNIDGGHIPSFQFPILNPASKTGYSGFSEAWRYIHQTCHLPIYLEEAPPGPDETSFVEWCQKNSVRSIEEYLAKNKTTSSISRKGRKGRSDQLSIQFDNSSQEKTFLDLFMEKNELHDLNAKKLRYLLTLTEFLGRMLRLNKLIRAPITKSDPMNSPPISSYNSSDNISLSRQPTIDPIPLSAVVTWLSLCVHWPFLTSWLVLFFEEHWSIQARDDDVISIETSTIGSTNLIIGGQAKNLSNLSSTEKLLNGSIADVDTTSIVSSAPVQPIKPTDKLSDLYKRVLAKLSHGVRSSRHHLHSISLGNLQSARSLSSRLPGNSTMYQHNMSKILYEMSLRDMDPSRLESYLRPIDRKDNSIFGRDCSGNLRAGHLAQVMNLSPFLNPQIRRWIREILRTKGFAVSKSLAKDRELARHLSRRSMNLIGQGSNIVNEYFEEEFNKAISSRLNLTECIVKLKNGMPRKNLSEMTVNEVCRMIHEIEGLAQDQTTGQISSLKMFYENRIRQLNISGTVLAVCDFNDLRSELEMSFGDWHLFSSLISYLKTQEMKRREGNRLNKSSLSLHHELPLQQEESDMSPMPRKSRTIAKSNLDVAVGKVNRASLPDLPDQVAYFIRTDVVESGQELDTADGDVEVSTESPCNCEYWYSIDKEKSPVERYDRSCSPKSPTHSQSGESGADSFTCYLDDDSEKSSIFSIDNEDIVRVNTTNPQRTSNGYSFEYEMNSQISPRSQDILGMSPSDKITSQ